MTFDNAKDKMEVGVLRLSAKLLMFVKGMDINECFIYLVLKHSILMFLRGTVIFVDVSELERHYRYRKVI